MVDVSDISRVKWYGKWIWDHDVTARRIRTMGGKEIYVGIKPEEQNTFKLIRKTFEVDSDLECATINITADSRYKLFVNGRYVGRGINRCEDYYWYYNTYDITDYLQSGKNVIAISARFYGKPLAYYTPPKLAGRSISNSGKGGVLFDVNLHYATGDLDKDVWFGSDNECKIITNPAEKSDMPIKNGCLGVIEELDSSKLPKSWNEVDFDDDEWREPKIYDYPIKTLIIDENAPLDEEFYVPERILDIGQSNDIRSDDDMDDEDLEEMDFCVEHMLEGKPEPNKSFQVINQSAILTGDDICEIRPNQQSDGKVLSIFVKFPKEMVGYSRIIVDGPKGTIVDLIPSEKMQNNLPALDFMSNKRGVRFVLRGDKQFLEQWDWEGFCFMMVKIRNLNGPLKIYKLGANTIHMRTEQKGRFVCDNEDLNELWEVCAHTVLCCGTDAYLDCPSREQRAYLGDAYPEALIANACFGEPRLTKKLIYDTAYGQREDGITFSFHPGDAKAECHIIPDYCFYWIQITKDYYQYYGDEKVLIDLYPHFIRALDWFWKYIDSETGLLSDVPYWLFIDWSFPHDKPGKWAILNTQFMDVLNFIADLAEKFNDKDKERKYRKQANRLKKSIDDLFWDDNEGCYRDYYHEGELHGFSQMTNAYVVLMDVAPEEKWGSVIERIFDFPGAEENDKKQIDAFYLKRLSHHAFGDRLKEMVVVAQPFFMHQVNKFLFKVGRTDLLMKYLKKWIPMLKLGPTKTIWETWSIAGSECHAWAATPAYDLSTYWMGISPMAPGFAEVKIAPTFQELKQVEGTYPTCKGNVNVKWAKSTTEDGVLIDLDIELPDEIATGIFIVPSYNGKQPQKVDTQLDIVSRIHLELKAGNNKITLIY